MRHQPQKRQKKRNSSLSFCTALGRRAWGGVSFCLLIGCGATPLPQEAPETGFQEHSVTALSILRARVLEEQIASSAFLRTPTLHAKFGDTVSIHFELQNPFGESFELLEPATGFLLQVQWGVERWLPSGAHDSLQSTRNALLDRSVSLEAGEVFQESAPLELTIPGDPGAIWEVTVQATLRMDGILFEEELHPVSKVHFPLARFYAFPGGWETLADAPLDNLTRLVGLAPESVDRHLLVCCALLQQSQKRQAIRLLVDSLATAPNRRRAVTIAASLAWMTGFEFGLDQQAWKEWIEEGKMKVRHDT